jgi:hypothetical protein
MRTALIMRHDYQHGVSGPFRFRLKFYEVCGSSVRLVARLFDVGVSRQEKAPR